MHAKLGNDRCEAGKRGSISGEQCTPRLNLGVAPYLDRLSPWDVVREISGVEVAEHRSDRDKQFRTLDLFKDFRVTDRPNVNLAQLLSLP